MKTSKKFFLAAAGLLVGLTFMPEIWAQNATINRRSLTGGRPNTSVSAQPANDVPINVKFVDAKNITNVEKQIPKVIERLLIVDSPANQVFDLLERLTGRSVLRSQEIPVLRINFDSKGPIEIDKAIIALESLLALNGVAVLPEGDDFLKVVISGYATSEAPPLYVDSVEALPVSERTIARLFTLKNVNVQSVEPLMRGMITNHRGGSLISLPTGNAFLITDSLANIQRIERLIKDIDVSGQVLFFNLKNTKASEISNQLQRLQGLGLKNLLQGEVAFSYSEMNNQLIVMTSKANEERITEIIEKLDVENVPLTKSAVFPLKYADADAVASALKSVIEGSRPNATNQNRTASVTTIGNGTTSSSSRSTSSSTSSSGNRSNSSMRSYSVDSLAPMNNQNNATYSIISTPVSSESVGNTLLQGTESNNGTDTTQRFSDYLTIIGDTRANSIVAFGTNSDIKQIEDVIEKIDVSLRQVRIEVIVVEVVLEEGDVSGLNSLGIGYKLTPSSISSSTLNGEYRFSATAPDNAMSLTGSLRDFAMEVVLNQASKNNKVKILSSPTIVTMHNKEAQITIGEQRPIITGSTTDTTNPSASSSQVTYKNIGLELQVTPRIGADKSVQMDVSQKMENVIATTIIDNNEQPIVSTRQATSYISAQNGETIVLAGLQSFEEQDNKGKVFLLGDIPLLGRLFSPENYSSSRRELVVFLRPIVVDSYDNKVGKLLGTRPESLANEEARSFIETGRFPQMVNPDTKKTESEKTK